MDDYNNRYLESLIRSLKRKRYKISETEYSFDGGMSDDCICVAKQEDSWEVYHSNHGEKTVLGIFYNERWAYDYVFYLVMKKHMNVKKRWPW